MGKKPRRWLTKQEQQLWRSYLEAQFRLTKYLNIDVEKNSGFDSLTYEILVRLSESPERSLRMSSLGERVSAGKSRLTYRISQLEKMGWVKRTEAPEDKRGQLCVLTDKGFKILDDAAPAHVQAVLTQFIDQIKPSDVKKLKEIFDSIAPNVQCDESAGD